MHDIWKLDIHIFLVTYIFYNLDYDHSKLIVNLYLYTKTEWEIGMFYA